MIILLNPATTLCVCCRISFSFAVQPVEWEQCYNINNFIPVSRPVFIFIFHKTFGSIVWLLWPIDCDQLTTVTFSLTPLLRTEIFSDCKYLWCITFIQRCMCKYNNRLLICSHFAEFADYIEKYSIHSSNIIINILRNFSTLVAVYNTWCTSGATTYLCSWS